MSYRNGSLRRTHVKNLREKNMYNPSQTSERGRSWGFLGSHSILLGKFWWETLFKNKAYSTWETTSAADIWSLHTCTWTHMNMHMLSMLSIANWEPSVLAKYWALCHFIHEKGAAEGGYTVGCGRIPDLIPNHLSSLVDSVCVCVHVPLACIAVRRWLAWPGFLFPPCRFGRLNSGACSYRSISSVLTFIFNVKVLGMLLIHSILKNSWQASNFP